MNLVKCKATRNYGVPNRRMLSRIVAVKKPQESDDVWPKLPNGQTVNNGPKIIEGELYLVDENIFKGRSVFEVGEDGKKKAVTKRHPLIDIFEKVKNDGTKQ